MDETALVYCELSCIGQQVLREMGNYNYLSCLSVLTKKYLPFFPLMFLHIHIVKICPFRLLILL